MVLIVCVDEGMGMMFNRRRQSKDALVRTDMLAMLPEEKRLLVTPYTAKQFLPEEQERLEISENVLALLTSERQTGQGAATEAGRFFFAEDTDVAGLEEATEQVVLYRWNRAYPSDVKFTFDLSGYELVSSEDFVGNSHPEMKKEVYRRR